MNKAESTPSFLGHHVLAEFNECSLEVLNNHQFLKELMEESAVIAGATIVKSVFHQFSPFGTSGVVVIEESHFAIHTWPEHNYAAIDLFTCNVGMDFMKAYEHLASGLKSKDHSYALHKRGIINS
jgi:S-adenosylmethionine decarboxylase proenzyme